MTLLTREVYNEKEKKNNLYLSPRLLPVHKTAHVGPSVEHSSGVWEVMDSVPGQVLPRTLEMLLLAFLLKHLPLKG